MPILIPIQDAPEPEVTVEIVFAGSSDLTADISLKMNLAAAFLGQSSLTPGAVLEAEAGVTFLGSSLLLPSARLNDEANIFAACAFAGASALDFTTPNSHLEATAIFAGSSNLIVDPAAESADEASFLIFVDIFDTALQTALNNNIRRYKPKFLVNGVEVSIRRASLDSAPDVLGNELKVTLAAANVALVPLDADITFQLGFWVADSYQYVTLLQGGKLSARSNAVKNDGGRPTDEVTISIVDIVASRWNKAPRVPTFLYDPQQVSAPSQGDIVSQRIILDDGSFVVPEVIAIPGMRLRDVINAAYVDGMGFASVVTNIPNFPVHEASFTLDGGYDAGVRPLLSLFTPLVYEQANTIFIVDPDAPLPSGVVARDFEQFRTRELSDSIPGREPTNAILVRMKSGLQGDYFTERFSVVVTSAGLFGTTSFTETTTSLRVREYRTFADPTTIVREEVVENKTEVVDYTFTLIERTTVNEFYDTLGRKTGYSRRSDLRLPDVNNDGAMTLMTDVTRQEQSITYTTNPLNATEDIQDTVTTVESGLILVDPGTQYLEQDYRIPLMAAHQSGFISPGGEQHTEQGDIRTTIESLRVHGQQVDVEVRIIDHISNAPSRSTITTRPGGVTTNRREQQGTITRLLTIPGTEADGRRVQIFDAGELPPDIALNLARRKLRRLNSPPREIAVTPAAPDTSIKRGTVLAIHARNDVVIGTYIVKGWTITVDEFRSEVGIQAAMTLTARELLI